MDKCFDGICFIFDNDGVIVDTEPGHFLARCEALLPLGICLTKERYIRDGISRGHREFLSSVVPVDKLLPDGYDRFFHEEIQARYHAWRENNLRLVDGFGDLFRFLADNNASLAVASTQPRAMVESGLRRCFSPLTMECFRIIVSGEEVKNNKPAPDVYLEAARRLGVEPANCLAVEDSVSGVSAAKAAGTLCVARRNEWANDGALIAAGADALCAFDYHDFLILARIVLRKHQLGRS